MPKRNGFFIFLNQRRAELINQGMTLTRGFAEVAELINEEWQRMPEQQKLMYKEVARCYNEEVSKTKVDNATGSPQPSTSKKSAEMLNKGAQKEPMPEADMRILLEEIAAHRDLAIMPIVIIQFSVYCDGPGDILRLAEVGISAFNVSHGVFDNYASLIDPKEFPETEILKVQAECKKLAVPMPNYNIRLQNLNQILQDIYFFLKMHSERFYNEIFIFCRSKDLKQTEKCLNWLFQKTGFQFEYKLLSLELVVQIISYQTYQNNMKMNLGTSQSKKMDPETMEEDSSMDTDEDDMKTPAFAAKRFATDGFVVYPRARPFIKKGIFFQTSDVASYFNADNYAYHEELACLYHAERNDGVYYCPLNIANRYAFSLLDVLVINFKVDPIPGVHYPTLNFPESELQQRRDFLDKWVLLDYSELASIEKTKDEDLQLKEEANNVLEPQRSKSTFKSTFKNNPASKTTNKNYTPKK